MNLAVLGKLSFNRPISSYSKIRSLYGRLARGKKLQLKRLRSKDYLNVGCGPNSHPQFINLDYEWLPGVDLVWDITTGIPLPPNGFSGIYSEHCLEHLSYRDTQKTLKNFFDLLKPGGTLRIVVPDAELYLKIYQDQSSGKNASFPYGQSAHDISAENVTAMMVVNSVFRGHGHQYAYDFTTMCALLKEVGFVDIVREEFRQGRDSQLLIDTETRRCESLYVEASKP